MVWLNAPVTGFIPLSIAGSNAVSMTRIGVAPTLGRWISLIWPIRLVKISNAIALTGIVNGARCAPYITVGLENFRA